MRIKITCSSCRTKYLCTSGNTNIKNPIITSKCSNCGEVYQGNVSAFAFSQANFNLVSGRIRRAATMINLMQDISSVVNDDKHGVKMRKYVARRWNSQLTN